MSEQVDKIRIDHIHMAREIPKKDWLKSDHKIATLLKRIAELEAENQSLTISATEQTKWNKELQIQVAELKAAMREAASKRYFNAALQVLAEALGDKV